MSKANDQLRAFLKWLNPRGQRDLALVKAFRPWMNEIEGGMHKRRIALGLEEPPEGEEVIKRRPVRKVVAGGVDRDDDGGGYPWRVSIATRERRMLMYRTAGQKISRCAGSAVA